jgi:2-polyprenyl-3-methyl-5-hydroxy-6-metoxy-1,4-benzoquinol methylase
MSDYREWDTFYRDYPLEELGWELGKPRPILKEYLKAGLLPKGKALDVCCGAGTNTVYLAQKGFEVTGIDISRTAIEFAKRKAAAAGVSIDFLNESFIELPFVDGQFGFVWDMGCFHHVEIEERSTFIAGLHRVLKADGAYMLTCFSYRNNPGWNHFTKQQLVELFSGFFEFGEFRHYPSLEGDGVTRFFYTVLMKKKQAPK